MVNRKNAMLTQADRAFLRGESEYGRQARYQRRESIKAGIRQTMQDFSLLVEEFDITELYGVFDEVVPDELAEQVSAAIAVCYLASEPLELSFEDLLEHGLTQIPTQQPGYAPSPVVDVSIDTRGIRLDEIAGKLLQGESLADEDYWFIVRLLADVPDRFRTVFEGELDERLLEKVERGSPLSTEEKQAPINHLKNQSPADLWNPILEAGALPYDDESIEDLKQRTSH